MKTRTRTKLITGIIAMILSVAIIFATCYTVGKPTVVNAASVRTVELSNDYFDDQSIFDEFDEHTLTTEGSVTYFEGFKTLSADILSEINLISEQNLDSYNDSQLRYTVSFDVDTNRVVASATITKEDGSVEYDEISGDAFFNEKGEIDAYMNIDGETILLSELRGAGMIENCGWLSRLFKAVVTIVVSGIGGALIGAVAITAVSIAENKIAETNKAHNKSLTNPSDYINGQDYYSDWKYGTKTIDDNGCGPIAVFNTMLKLKKEPKFADVLYDLEKYSGTLFMGAAGADPTHLSEYFKNNGVSYKSYNNFSQMQSAINNMSTSQMAIICFWNGSTVFEGAHYAAVEKVVENNTTSYRIYNAYSNRPSFLPVDKVDKSYTGGDLILGYICG